MNICFGRSLGTCDLSFDLIRFYQTSVLIEWRMQTTNIVWLKICKYTRPTFLQHDIFKLLLTAVRPQYDLLKRTGRSRRKQTPVRQRKNYKVKYITFILTDGVIRLAFSVAQTLLLVLKSQNLVRLHLEVAAINGTTNIGSYTLIYYYILGFLDKCKGHVSKHNML